MGQNYFIWKGTDCRSMGVYLPSPAPIVRPEERIQHIQIPGVSGDLTQIEGENIYNSYIQTVTLHVKNGYRVREVFDWLRGAGYVIFSGEPDRKQRARIIGAITLNRFSRNIDTWIGECQFYCQPLKERLTEETERVSQSGTEVLNLGDVAAHPLISCHATDAGQDLQFTVGGEPFRVNMTGMADTGCVIDCAAQIVTNYAGSVDLTGLSTGKFPVLGIGKTVITFENGVSSLDILKRERFL